MDLTQFLAHSSPVTTICPRSQNPELIPRSVVLSHDDHCPRQISDSLFETAVLPLDKCDIMRHVFLPFYQAEVELSMPFTVWCFAHWCSLLCPLVGKKKPGVLCHQQVLGETRTPFWSDRLGRPNMRRPGC